MNEQLPGSIAGILVAGAAVPGGRAWIQSHLGRSSPALFGAVGTLDPNYEEVRAFDVELDGTGTRHHVERFDGRHEWPPPDVCARAVAWFELQAMRRTLVARDQRWVDSLYADWLASAARIDDSFSAITARRGIERVFVHMSFYVPRELFAQRRYAHAALALRLARRIKPEDGDACLGLARALAQTGELSEALEAFECAAASNQVRAAAVERDPLLEPLRGAARFRAALARLPK